MQPRSPSRLRRIALSTLLGAVLIAGCVSMDDIHTARSRATALRDSLVADESLLQSRLMQTAEGDPSRSLLEAQLASSRTARAALDAAIGEVDLALSHQSDPASLLGILSGLVPHPWRAPLVLGGAAAALFLRSRQLRTGLISVARGIEIAKREDDSFRQRFEANANIFRSVQTQTAQKLVDEVTAKAA